VKSSEVRRGARVFRGESRRAISTIHSTISE
jgi:hypothetical protein